MSGAFTYCSMSLRISCSVTMLPLHRVIKVREGGLQMAQAPEKTRFPKHSNLEF